MPTNETHNLVTIADLFRVVTADNVEALAADIRGLLINTVLTKGLVEAASGPEAVAKMFANSDVSGIKWCDDGVNSQKLKATSKDGKTLEFVTTKLKD